MTEQEIERCLERFAMGKACDVMNFDYAGTFAYIQRLKAENAELKSSLTHANEECLKWHERAQNLLKDSGGTISGYEKKISDLQAENAALRARLEKAVELPRIIHPNEYEWFVQYQNKYGLIFDEIFYSERAAEARLKELKEKNDD